MRLEIQFRHMERSEALETLVTDKVSHAIDEFSYRHDAHVQVWLISDLNLTTRGTGEFICEIDIRYPRKKHLFIQKKATDMHAAIQEAADTLEVLLDETGKRELSARREPKPEPKPETSQTNT